MWALLEALEKQYLDYFHVRTDIDPSMLGENYTPFSLELFLLVLEVRDESHMDLMT